MKSITLLFIMAGILTTTGLLGQEVIPADKTKDQNVSLRKDMTLVQRDQKELNQFHKKAKRFNDAWEKQDMDKLQKAKIKLVSDMKREVSQGNKYARRYRKELRKTQIEKRYEGENIGDNARTGHPPVDDRAERRNRRLQQRDMRGHLKALDRHNDIVRKQKSILNAFKNYDFRYTRDDMEAGKKRGLIDEFAKTMDEDLRLKKMKIDNKKNAMKR
ncbi:MAG TPA: hypothetical protein VE870_12225 [Bacteroidales bacterium]|nr:hypothetical protein [Bacteroidales bacterium]